MSHMHWDFIELIPGEQTLRNKKKPWSGFMAYISSLAHNELTHRGIRKYISSMHRHFSAMMFSITSIESMPAFYVAKFALV